MDLNYHNVSKYLEEDVIVNNYKGCLLARTDNTKDKE